jgi:hypothetical protein
MVSKGHSKTFSASWALEKAALMKSLKFVLSRRIALELKICLLDVLKNDFGEADEAMFQGVEKPCEQILCFLGIEKATWLK